MRCTMESRNMFFFNKPSEQSDKIETTFNSNHKKLLSAVSKNDFSDYLAILEIMGGIDCVISMEKTQKSAKTLLHAVIEAAKESEYAEKIAATLIEKNAPLDTKDENGETPLHLAIYAAQKTGVPKIVCLLVEKGAILTSVNQAQKTPRQIAGVRGKLDIEKYLHDKEKNIQPIKKSTEGEMEIIENNTPDNLSTNLTATPLFFNEENKKISAHERHFLENLWKLINTYCSKESSVFTIFNDHITKAKQNSINVKEIVTIARGWQKTTMLHIAAKNNSTEFVEKLINEGAPVDAEDYQNETPLFYVFKNPGFSEETFNALIRKKANIAHTNKYGESLLIAAIKANNLPAIKVLIETYKLSVNPVITCKEQKLPLHLAIEQTDMENGFEIVGYLLSGGADINTIDGEGNTVLHYAVATNSNIFNVISKNPNLNKELYNRQNNSGKNILHYACFANQIEIKEIVSRMNPLDVTKADDTGNTPLHYATQANNSQAFEIICGKISSVHKSDSIKNIIDIAAKNTQISSEIIKSIYTFVKHDHKTLVTCLGLTLRYGNRQFSNFLISNLEYSKFHAPTKELMFVRTNEELRYAISYKNSQSLNIICQVIESFKIKIELSALLSFINRFNTQADIDFLKENDGILNLLSTIYTYDKNEFYAPDKDGNTPLHMACDLSFDTIALLFLKKMDIKDQTYNKAGMLAFHLAIKNKHIKIVEELLKQKMPKERINSADSVTGEIPLFSAVKNDDVPMYELLKKNRVSLLYINTARQTMVHTAAAYGSINCLKAIFKHLEMIKSIDKELNREDQRGNTPLDLATQNKKQDVICFLTEKGAKTSIEMKSGKPVEPLTEPDDSHSVAP